MLKKLFQQTRAQPSWLGPSWLDGPMTYNSEVYRRASALVNDHGEAAPIHAAMQAQMQLDEGDRAVYSLWKCIGSMCNVLLSRTALADSQVP